MKRVVLGILGLMFWLAAAPAQASNTSLTYGIVVSVCADPIDLSGETSDVNWGMQPFQGTVFSNLPQGQPRSTVSQNGYATLNLMVSATVAAVYPSSPSWVLTSSLPAGPNEARLSGLFTAPLAMADESPNPSYYYTLSAGDFGIEDAITGVPKTATSTVFARPGEQPNFLGCNVSSIDPTRSLRYMLNLPVPGSTTTPQRIAVTISATLI